MNILGFLFFLKDLQKILEDVHLAYLVDREGGFEANNDWNDVLSGILNSKEI